MTANPSTKSKRPIQPGSLKPSRVGSLDALRGFDLFLLLGLGPIFGALSAGPLKEMIETMPVWGGIAHQFHHVSWEGFVMWDLIMPLFIFLAGVTIPFSLSRYTNRENGRPSFRLFWRITRRVLLLWLFGMIVQGNLLDLKLDGLRLFSNTLQAIAIGYLLAVIVYLLTGKAGQLIAAVFLMMIFWASMSWMKVEVGGELFGGGSYLPESNLAEGLDRLVFGRWRDGVSFAADGSWAFSEGYRYTWFLSSLTFGATAIFGVIAGELVKAGRIVTIIPLAEERAEAEKQAAEESEAEELGDDEIYSIKEDKLLRPERTPKVRPWQVSVPGHSVALKLFLWGITLTAIGWLWGKIPEGSFSYCPMVKKIWTPSMTLFSAGLSFVLLSIFYEIIDVMKFRLWARFLIIIGTNSILAYILGQLFHGTFCDATARILYGTEQFAGVYYETIIQVGGFMILWGILWALWRNKHFLRV